MDTGRTVLWGALLVSTLLNAVYFAPIVLRAFFGKPHPAVALEQYGEAPVPMVAALCFTALVSVLLGLYPEAITQFFDVLARG
jgi:multicomponent Na+:H+ antiporter subunit D